MSPIRSRVSKKAASVASGVGISVRWLRDAALRASSATSGVFMSGSDGILHVPHFFRDVVEGRVAVDL